MRGRVLAVQQRTDAWQAARLGRLNSSHADRLLSKGRGKSESDKTKRLRLELVTERLTELPTQNSTVTAPMIRGIELESRARVAFEAHSGSFVETVGYVQHEDPTVMAGASPDGLILGDDCESPVACLEIKCPTSVKHLEYLSGGAGVVHPGTSGTAPATYLPQLRHLAWITGLPITFVSYDDRFRNINHHLYVATLSLNQLALDEYNTLARAFLDNVDTLYKSRR